MTLTPQSLPPFILMENNKQMFAWKENPGFKMLETWKKAESARFSELKTSVWNCVLFSLYPAVCVPSILCPRSAAREHVSEGQREDTRTSLSRPQVRCPQKTTPLFHTVTLMPLENHYKGTLTFIQTIICCCFLWLTRKIN